MPDWIAYLQRYPDVQAWIDQNPQQFQSQFQSDPSALAQFHYNTFGRSEGRTIPGTNTGYAGNSPTQGGTAANVMPSNPYGTAPFTGPGGTGLPMGSNTNKIQPNMAPPANFWDGDKFVIGAPGMQAGSQQAQQGAGQMPASSMPASFAGGGMAGYSPAASASPMPNAGMGGSTQSAGQMVAGIGQQLMPKFDMQGMGGNPFLRGLMGNNQTMGA